MRDIGTACRGRTVTENDWDWWGVVELAGADCGVRSWKGCVWEETVIEHEEEGKTGQPSGTPLSFTPQCCPFTPKANLAMCDFSTLFGLIFCSKWGLISNRVFMRRMPFQMNSTL